MIFLSILSLFLVILFQRGSESAKVQKEFGRGGIIFIGPIPIVIGKDKSITKTMLYIGRIIAVLLAVNYALIIFT